MNEEASKPTGETYEIRSVEDFLALAPDRRITAIVEFAAWCMWHDKAKRVAEGLAELGVTLKPDASVYRWVDDGKGEMRPRITGPQP